MRASRLLWQLLVSYIFLTVTSLVAVSWLASRSLERSHLDQLGHDLRQMAVLLEPELGSRISPDQAESLTMICRRFSETTGSRITLVLPSGQVLIDTLDDPALMDNHGERPEVRAALDGLEATERRYSSTARESMTYQAIPLRRDGQIVAALRTAVSTASINQSVRRVQWQIAAGGLAIAALAALASLWFAWRISRPLEEIRHGAERLALGDLGHKLPEPGSAEAAGVVQALNRMADQLKERIRATVRQSSEQEAVLASMAEGVLAVDNDERIISLNQAAAELLSTSQAEAQGRSLQEVIRNAELRRFVTGALNCDMPVEGDLVLGAGQDRQLQAHGTALRDVQGQAIGAVIVLNDITRLRRLESLRRDFVANVSHELKTPITSIKGFVETLLEGALDNRQDAERFLHIMARQADRLDSIIEDLLSLSKIEQGEESGDIELSRQPVRHALTDALDEIRPKADERAITIELHCDESITARVNRRLLEQAVLNLLDNAVKYSGPGSKVELRVEQAADEVTIAVCDQGCGIEAEHLPRLFERFYRVDKARSRKLGGTGLGLAIVKHIVHAHQGQVTVDSSPGRGSIFVIHLPLEERPAEQQKSFL
ncbi:MAG: two-component system histidine kinase PnpS [Pirellulales bacterium]